MTQSNVMVATSISDKSTTSGNDIAKKTSAKSNIVRFDVFRSQPEHYRKAKPIVARMLKRIDRLDTAIGFDKKENPSKKDVLNPEDMPNGKLVSDDSTLHQNQLTILEVVTQIKGSMVRLEALLAQNPELATARAADFNPSTAAMKSVREAVWEIFNETGRIIGRNSPEAVKADTRVWVLRQETLFQTYNREPERFIVEKLKPIADMDMQQFLGDAQVYFHKGHQKLSAFYATLANLRRRTFDRYKRISSIDLPLRAQPRK
jgi:hypothetical protein